MTEQNVTSSEQVVGFMLKKLNDEDPYPGIPEPPLFTSEPEDMNITTDTQES